MRRGDSRQSEKQDVGVNCYVRVGLDGEIHKERYKPADRKTGRLERLRYVTLKCMRQGDRQTQTNKLDNKTCWWTDRQTERKLW